VLINTSIAIATDTTWPAGDIYTFDTGGTVTVNAGVTLTIRGEVVAPRRQIFLGPGSVVGIRRVTPEWFGAIGDGAANDAPALQKAHDCMALSAGSDGREQVLSLAAKNYLLASTLTVRPNPYFSPRIRGAGPLFGTRLIAAPTFTGNAVLFVDGSVPNSFNEIADYELSGFFVFGTPGTNCPIGIRVGIAGHRLTGLHNSLIENVRSENFQQCWYFCNSRNITVRRCSGKGLNASLSKALAITVEADNQGVNFTGDMIFDGCQWEQGTANHQRCISILSTVSGGGVAGLKFINNTTYGGHDAGIAIEVSGGGNATDIWITDCQMDAGSYPIRIEAYGAGSYIHDIHVTNMYAQGVQSNAVQIIGSDGTMVRDVHINGGRINGVNGEAVSVNGARSIIVNGMVLNAINSGAAIEFYNAQVVAVTGCIFSRAAAQAGGSEPITAANMVKLSGYTDYANITGNCGGYACSGGVVSNLASGTHNLVASNN